MEILEYTSTRAQAQVRGKSPVVKRVRSANEALPPELDLWMRGTYDGAELKPFEGRPGAMDFKKCPSRGLG